VQQKGNFAGGVPHGPWKWFYETGELLRDENYYRGRQDGEMVEYHKNGEIVAKGKFIDGYKTGDWYYHVGDHIQEGAYKAGKREGVWKNYYLDGALKFEGEFLRGYENGKHTYYYPNRQVKKQGKYIMGKKDGTWYKYDQQGNVILTITYDNGKEIKVDGKKITEAK
jgi:uncharacterized protein